MASQWLKARQTKYAAYATTYILVIIAVFVVANVLADRYNKSYDCHVEQALQPLRADGQDRQRPEAGRDDHLLQPEHSLQRRQRSAGRSTRISRPRCTWITWIIDKNPQLARDDEHP